MHGNKLFQDMTKEEKISFFIQCQNLLLNYHPHSEFIFKTDNFKSRLNHVLSFIKKYQGFVHQSNSLCLLYNYIKINDPKEEPVTILKNHMYHPPALDYNAIVIDFVVFDKLSNCVGFYQGQDSSKVKYALFVRNSKVKLYTTDKLLKGLRI